MKGYRVLRPRHNWVLLVGLAGLCLLSFAHGVYRLGEQSLWWDESLSHYRATRPFWFILSNHMTFLSGTQEVPIQPDNHPPLYFVLLRMAVLTAGDSEFAMRFLSLVAGVLTVPLLYQCGKSCFGTGCGVLAACLSALSPLYLWAQQEARPYALGTLLATASFYALMRMLTGAPVSIAASLPARLPARWTGLCPWLVRVQGARWYAAYVLCTLAMLATHYQSLLLLPAQGIIVLVAWRWHKPGTLRRAAWVLAIIGLAAVGVLVGVAQMMPIRADVPGFGFIPLGVLLQDVLRSFPLGISGAGLVPFLWIGVALLCASLVVLVVRRQQLPWHHGVYLGLCFTLPIAEIYAISLVRPAYMNVRHLIFASPFYYLLLAAGLSQARGFWARVPMGLAMAALVLGMLCSTYAYFTDSRYEKEDHRAWGRYLSEHVRPDDLVLINPGPISELYFYYVHSPASWLGFPLLYTTPDQTISQLTELVSRHDRVWVATSMTPYWADPNSLTVRWLQENTSEIAFASFHSATTIVQAHAFRLRPPVLDSVPLVSVPLALSFGGSPSSDQLLLSGLDAPLTPVASGHTLRLSLYWSAARPTSRRYRVALSLTDHAGFAWASLDYEPCSGTYPTDQWPAGRIVRDDVDLDIPPAVPPGEYRIAISVYPADRSGPALAASSADTDTLLGLIVPLGQVQVVAPSTSPRDAELPIAHRARQRYGRLSLLGHDYGGGSYQPGDIVLLGAYWRANGHIPRQEGTLVALQLVDEAGTIWAEQPIAPVDAYPLDQWSPGQVARGQYRFRIPIGAPPGEYALRLVPGDALSRRRWPWDDGRVTLNTLTVLAPRTEGAFQVPPMEHTVGAVLGGQVELLGYDLESDTVRAGQVVSCTLYWRAVQAQGISQNYTVFTHLVAPDGRTWGQWDNQPQGGQLPTSRWAPGQVVADPYQIPVQPDAPAGTLVLSVGMYDLYTMVRLPVSDPDGTAIGDAIDIASIEAKSP